jgi:hypothetical protein
MTDKMKMKNVERFFAYATAREQIRIKKEAGLPAPWTDDPILQKYRFCNVYREDDKVTRWIRAHITEAAYGKNFLAAIILARWFNRISTLERLALDGHSLFGDLYRDDRVRLRLHGVAPVVTAAYVIKTPNGMNKLDGVLWSYDLIRPDCAAMQEKMKAENWSLQFATAHLATYPYLGPFMAYEIVTDLRHSSLLEKAPDIMTWANPGPGCARGISRIVYDDPNVLKRSSREDVYFMNQQMYNLLYFANNEGMGPAAHRPWEMREVEHTLCEFDKYERVRLGEGEPKQLYREQ